MEENHARKSQQLSFQTSSSCRCCINGRVINGVLSCEETTKPTECDFKDMHTEEERIFEEEEEEEELSLSMLENFQFVDIQWNEVENRFDRLALARGGSSEPVVKWSEFGYCIGMQHSAEFASELLRALSRRTSPTTKHTSKNAVGITKGELRDYWACLTHPCLHSRLRIFFDVCDRDMDGKINENDLKQVILLSATTNKLSLTHEEAKEYAALIMGVLDHQNHGYIEQHQLASLLKLTLPRASNWSTPCSYNAINNSKKEAKSRSEKSKAEILFRSYWREAWILLLWLMICLLLFTWKFIQYRHRTAFQVMGYCLCTAKGAAETLKFNMALILLPVCRNSITLLRKSSKINSVVPFNDNINFHKLIAGSIVIGVILHGGTHLACDFPRISGSDHSLFTKTIADRFGYHQPSYIQIIGTTEVATGIAMVILMSIAFLLATRWPRRQSPSLPRSIRRVTGYNTFWYSHHLLILVYGLLIVHSMFLFLTSNLYEKTTWIYVAFPLLLYTGERITRAIRSRVYDVQILKASNYPGKVLSLKMQKPEVFKYRSGSYIFIQCPQISPFQWHPFSLTSGPEDDHLSIHIRSLGDWSYQMYSTFQEVILSGVKKYPKVYIDGPYGAASQDHIKYDIVMLIGLGIGATPFISILKDVANGLHKSDTSFDNYGGYSDSKSPLNTYFYWVTREQNSFDWFRASLKEITKANQTKSVIEIHNFLTTVYQEGDARSALLSAIKTLHHAKTGIDIVSRLQVQTHFSRPNWFNIFSKMVRRHQGAKIGVFYCGPIAVARELERLCTKFSTRTTTRFVFHKENY